MYLYGIILTIVLSIIFSIIYYQMMEMNIPTTSNCSYLASIYTDILAFIYGAIIIGYGIKISSYVLITLGTTLFIEHILQMVHHKF